MKSLNAIGKDVLTKIFPEIVKSGFKSQITFFDHTIDIHRRIENLYSNLTRDFQNKNPDIKPYGIAIKFAVWGMELGIVGIPLTVVAENNASDNNALRKNLIDLISKCKRIKQTSYAPTHLIVIIIAEGKNWEQRHYEIYYMEKFQSDEIVKKCK